MKPIHYCYEKIASHGSPIYYSLKKIPSEKRDVVIAISAFYQEIAEILLKNTDPAMALQQFHWWRYELTQLLDKNASHPVTRALQASLFDSALIHRLFAIIDGWEQYLSFSAFDSFEDVVVYLMRTAGERELLIVEVLSLPEKIPAERIYQLTMVIEWVDYLQHLRRFVKNNIIFFSHDEMKKFNVSLELLSEYRTTSEIKELLHYQAQKIENAHLKAREALTPNENNGLAHLLSRCDIAVATLNEIKNHTFTVLENYIQLTPLKMWWIAYRA